MTQEGERLGPLTIITASPIADRYCDSRGKFPTYKRNNCLRLHRKEETPCTRLRPCQSLPNVKTGGASPSGKQLLCQSHWPSRDTSLDEKRKRELEQLAAGILVQENCSLQRPAIVALSPPQSFDKVRVRNNKEQRLKQSASAPAMDSQGWKLQLGVDPKAERQIAKSEYRRRRIIESAKFQKRQLERLRAEKEAQKEDYEKRMGKAQADLERKRWERMEEWEKKCSYYRVLIEDKKTAIYSKVQEERNRKQLSREQR